MVMCFIFIAHSRGTRGWEVKGMTHVSYVVTQDGGNISIKI